MRRPPVCCARRWRATRSAPTIPIGCCIRCAASARRAKGASSESPGRRRSRRLRIGSRAIAAEDPEQILPYSYAGTMGWCRANRCRSASSTGSARASSIGPSALPPAPPGTRSPWARASASIMESADEAQLIIFWGCNAITSSVHFWARAQAGEAPRGAAHRHRSLPLAHRREMPHSTSPCCREPTARSRSG